MMFICFHSFGQRVAVLANAMYMFPHHFNKMMRRNLFSTLFGHVSHSFFGYKCVIVNVLISLGYRVYLSFVTKL